MNRIVNEFLAIIFLLGFYSCNHTKSKEVKIKENGYALCCEVPPPPPPVPFQQFKTTEMTLLYYGKNISFRTTLLAYKMFDLNGSYLQTFLVIAKNHQETDTFYFALSPELNKYWQDLTIQKTSTEFNIGYFESKSFKMLYTICLGDKLNSGRIYMRKSIKIAE